MTVSSSKSTFHTRFFIFTFVFIVLFQLQSNEVIAREAIVTETVSTDSLRATTRINTVLSAAYEKYKNNQEGKNADYIKALADVDSELFGISIVTADGQVFEIGDTQSKFSIQSISKVFTYSKIMQEYGPEVVKEKIGVNATGLPFNSIQAIELIRLRAVNPFVNAGAIASTSLVQADNAEQRWNSIKTNMDDYAGHELEFNDIVYQSEVNDNLRNQAISKILQAYGRIYSDPLEATTVYTKQCSVNITSHDLAVMGAVLANKGLHPITHKRLLNAPYVAKVLSVMSTAGLYDNAGAWLYETGTPAKSGVGGGILAIVPGKLAIGVFSPPLDGYGNSVRGQLAASYIINELGLNPYDPEI